jgi:DNA-binding GntR family transcriptional regulator
MGDRTLSPNSVTPSGVDELSMVDVIVDHIREGLGSGRYSPGQRLIESDITEALGVSRGPLREALRRLAAEGLLEITHHRGARVRTFDRRELMGIFELREVLEGLAARSAARAVKSDSTLANRLRELAAEMNAATKAGRLQQYVGLNQELHDLIVDAADNPQLATLVRQLQTPTLRLVFRGILDRDMTRRSNAEHAKIIAAITAGDEEAAERAMRRHIRASREAVLDISQGKELA